MKKRFLIGQVLLACALSEAAVAASSTRNYPEKPITLLVGFAAGGSVDNAARIVAQRLQTIGWSVIVENRTGASGMIAMRDLAKSRPDGYTLMMGSVSNLAMVPPAMKDPQVDPTKDLAAVSLIGSAPLVLLVRADSPVKSLDDFKEALKKPGATRSYASGGIATPPHLAMELLASKLEVKLDHVPYRGEAPAIVDLLGGHVPAMFANMTTGVPYVKSGKLRAIGVSGSARSPVMEDVPTLAEGGVAGFNVENWFGIVAPRATPPEVLDIIHGAVSKALADPTSREQLSAQGLNVQDISRKEFDRFLAAENEQWTAVVKKVGIRLE